jgi:Holliday junction resolvase RusA-like endonuclease
VTVDLLANFEDCAEQSFSFFVAGKPETQGSKNAFGRTWTDNKGRQRVAVAMVEQSKGLYQWRSDIGRMAAILRPNMWRTDGIYTLQATFYMPRPKYHYNSKGELKPDAPVFHTKAGDADKLLRACGDALTKICYDDDALIVAASSVKLFCKADGISGVHVKVTRLNQEAAGGAAFVFAP